MRALPVVTAILGLILVSGCATARDNGAAAAPPAPDCSFRSATTCWTLVGRFPAARPSAGEPQPDRIGAPEPAVLATARDSGATGAPRPH